MEHESDSDTNCNWWIRYSAKGLVQKLEDLEISGREDIIQTAPLLRPAKILRRVLVTWENLL